MSRDDLPFREERPTAETPPSTGADHTVGHLMPPDDPHSAPPPPGTLAQPSMGVFLGIILLGDLVLVGFIIAVTLGGVPFAGALIWIAASAFIIVAILVCVRLLWNRVVAPFPARAPDGAVGWKHFRSFRLGIMNLGCCVHVGRDRDHLHLRLVAPLRWLGARSCSIPWSDLSTPDKQGRRVRINGTSLWGPRWAFEQP